MRSILLVVLGCILTAPLLAGEAETTAVRAFDAELAKRVGADERGMRQYVLCILKTGPKDA